MRKRKPSAHVTHDPLTANLVVLDPDQYDAWLSPKATARDVTDLIAGSRHEFEAYRVCTPVNSVRNDDAGLMEKLNH